MYRVPPEDVFGSFYALPRPCTYVLPDGRQLTITEEEWLKGGSCTTYDGVPARQIYVPAPLPAAAATPEESVAIYFGGRVVGAPDSAPLVLSEEDATALLRGYVQLVQTLKPGDALRPLGALEAREHEAAVLMYVATAVLPALGSDGPPCAHGANAYQPPDVIQALLDAEHVLMTWAVRLTPQDAIARLAPRDLWSALEAGVSPLAPEPTLDYHCNVVVPAMHLSALRDQLRVWWAEGLEQRVPHLTALRDAYRDAMRAARVSSDTTTTTTTTIPDLEDLPRVAPPCLRAVFDAARDRGVLNDTERFVMARWLVALAPRTGVSDGELADAVVGLAPSRRATFVDHIKRARQKEAAEGAKKRPGCAHIQKQVAGENQALACPYARQGNPKLACAAHANLKQPIKSPVDYAQHVYALRL